MHKHGPRTLFLVFCSLGLRSAPSFVKSLVDVPTCWGWGWGVGARPSVVFHGVCWVVGEMEEEATQPGGCVAGGVGSWAVLQGSRPPPGRRLAGRGLGFLCPKSLSIITTFCKHCGLAHEDIQASKGTWGSGDSCARWSWSLRRLGEHLAFLKPPRWRWACHTGYLLPTGKETGSGSAFFALTG